MNEWDRRAVAGRVPDCFVGRLVWGWRGRHWKGAADTDVSPGKMFREYNYTSREQGSISKQALAPSCGHSRLLTGGWVVAFMVGNRPQPKRTFVGCDQGGE